MEQLTLFDVLQYTGSAPTKAYPDDAGFDLAVEGDHKIPGHQFGQIPLKSRLMAPPGHWLMLIGRSSSFKNLGLLVNIGVIDPSYTGPLFAVCRNLSIHPITLRNGDRICQAIPIPLALPRLAEVPAFPTTARGENGFGSSGS